MDKFESTFKALGDRTRLRIMNILLKQELCVCEVMEALGLPQSKASRHLGILKNAGIILDRRDAQNVFYRVNSSDSNVSKFLESLAVLFSQTSNDDDLQRLASVLSTRVDNICCPDQARLNSCCNKSLGEEKGGLIDE